MEMNNKSAEDADDPTTSPGGAERALVLILRAVGLMMCLAAFAVFLPRSWMAVAHEALGLGAFPQTPIVDYLARSASALYALGGGLLWVLSMDPRRRAPVLTYSIWSGIVFGVVILGIDLHAGMPAHWTFSEGPFIIAFSLALLYLKAQAKL